MNFYAGSDAAYGIKTVLTAKGNLGIGTTTPGGATRLGIMGDEIRIDYRQIGNNFFACYTQSPQYGGRFILRWSGSGNDHNVQLIMLNNNENNTEQQAGFLKIVEMKINLQGNIDH